MIPEELRYTTEHEWIRELDGGRFQVGITDYAQKQLGDIVFVDQPTVGTAVTAGDSVGTIESVKAVSEIYAPLSGTVVEVNETLEGDPNLVNDGPYEDGWLFVIEASESVLAGLLDSVGYAQLIAEES